MATFTTPAQAVEWLRSRGVQGLTTDSREASRRGCIHCLAGCRDRSTALCCARTGARRSRLPRGAVVVQRHLHWIPIARAFTSGLKAGSGPIAAAFYGMPSRELAVMAVTGTNGKTSTAWWLAQALGQVGAKEAMPCGVIGTLGVGRPPALKATGYHDA